MLSLRLQNLSFAYRDSAPILEDASAHLSAGWTGLIGSNGSGKSTLLRLLRGQLRPARGQVRFEPAQPWVELCTQRVEELDDSVHRLAEAWDRSAQRLKGRLELDAAALDRWGTLSPGERKRWQIGAALWTEPHLLLLDEPTNHLDGTARELLVAALTRFRGIGILVSHDRALLDELTTTTLRLEGGELCSWPGSYSAARALWRARAEETREALDRGRREERKLKRHLADKRRHQRSAEGRISAASRMKGPRDHDARTMAAKNRVKTAEARLGRQVGLLRRQLAKRVERNAELRVEKTKGRSLFVDFEPPPRSRLIALNAERLSAGELPLLRDVHLVVDATTRVWIAGDNGAGKTTLLEALRHAAGIPEERLLYLPQELGTAEAETLLTEVRDLPHDERGRILELVAALGSDPERLLGSESLSPGEARKLKIAFGLGRQVWALLLDEPTNHLDLPLIERLEAMLSEYPGALVMVSHDPHLAEATAETAWRIDAGRVAVDSPGEVCAAVGSGR